MTGNLDIWLTIAGMAVVSYFCRAGGFWAMRFVRLTPRLEGVLAAMPSALFAAILARTVAHAGPVETAGVVIAFVLARLAGDFPGMLGGIAAVALLRAAGA